MNPRKYWGLAQRTRNQSASGSSQKARAEFETQLGVRGKAQVTGQSCSQAKCTEVGSQEARDMVQGTPGQGDGSQRKPEAQVSGSSQKAKAVPKAVAFLQRPQLH